jgi:dUTP pyrophosphatase
MQLLIRRNFEGLNDLSQIDPRPDGKKPPIERPYFPTRAYEGDAADDLYCSRNMMIEPNQTLDVHTDIFVKIPDGFFGRIVGRSSTLRKYRLIVNEGIIDAGYTGELFVCVYSLRNSDFTIEPGMRLAQLMLHRVVETQYKEVDALPQTQRGASGFGSSGV